MTFTGSGANTALRFTSSLSFSNQITLPTSSNFFYLNTKATRSTLPVTLSRRSRLVRQDRFRHLSSRGPNRLWPRRDVHRPRDVEYRRRRKRIRRWAAETSPSAMEPRCNSPTSLWGIWIPAAPSRDLSISITAPHSRPAAPPATRIGKITPVLNYSGDRVFAGRRDHSNRQRQRRFLDHGPSSCMTPDADNDNNNYGTAVYRASAGRYVSDPNKLITLNVAGPGLVQLQSGGVSSDETFSGQWNVQSGVLEVGPFPTTTPNWTKGPRASCSTPWASRRSRDRPTPARAACRVIQTFPTA